jgi:hypothetical protein
MRNLTIMFMMLIASFTFAQNVPIDFEPAGNGADWTWTVFENDDNPPHWKSSQTPMQAEPTLRLR